MKPETKSWMLSFLAGFLATVLGIFLTFGVENIRTASSRKKTAHLLAEQIVGKMDRTYQELNEYLNIYDAIDSTSMCLHLAILADTLDNVDDSLASLFLGLALSEYVQVDIDSGVEAYKTEILNNIGNITLLGHIDQFYSYARQYVDVSFQVVSQKRIVSDMVYAHFYGDMGYSDKKAVLWLHELQEFNIFYSRMQNVRLTLREIGKAMQEELNACHAILGIPKD